MFNVKYMFFLLIMLGFSVRAKAHMLLLASEISDFAIASPFDASRSASDRSIVIARFRDFIDAKSRLSNYCDAESGCL